MRTAGYAQLVHKTNKKILNEISGQFLKIIGNCNNKWLQYVHRMERDRLPRIILHVLYTIMEEGKDVRLRRNFLVARKSKSLK